MRRKEISLTILSTLMTTSIHRIRLSQSISVKRRWISIKFKWNWIMRKLYAEFSDFYNFSAKITILK